MKYYLSNTSFNKTVRNLTLGMMALMTFSQVDAQQRVQRQIGKPQRLSSPNTISRPSTTAPITRQAPVVNSQDGGRYNRNFNRQPQPQQIQPGTVQQQPRVNSYPTRRPSTPSPTIDNNRYEANRNYSTNRNNNNYRSANRYRRPVYSSTNPGWRYSYLPRRNSVITQFNYPYQTINYGGYGYRYCDGVYYRPYNNAFMVVGPPRGIFINTLPYGYRRITVRENPYYYYNGTYYDDYQSSYRVVAPPVGAIVESIPEGYETLTINGETYYKVDDVQYKPVVQPNGEIWYEVIKVD